MQIEGWLFLAAMAINVVLIVVDLIVWRVYSNSMAELKREVQVYKAAWLRASTYVNKIYEVYERAAKGGSSANRN